MIPLTLNLTGAIIFIVMIIIAIGVVIKKVDNQK